MNSHTTGRAETRTSSATNLITSLDAPDIETDEARRQTILNHRLQRTKDYLLQLDPEKTIKLRQPQYLPPICPPQKGRLYWYRLCPEHGVEDTVDRCSRFDGNEPSVHINQSTFLEYVVEAPPAVRRARKKQPPQPQYLTLLERLSELLEERKKVRDPEDWWYCPEHGFHCAVVVKREYEDEGQGASSRRSTGPEVCALHGEEGTVPKYTIPSRRLGAGAFGTTTPGKCPYALPRFAAGHQYRRMADEERRTSAGFKPDETNQRSGDSIDTEEEDPSPWIYGKDTPYSPGPPSGEAPPAYTPTAIDTDQPQTLENLVQTQKDGVGTGISFSIVKDGDRVVVRLAPDPQPEPTVTERHATAPPTMDEEAEEAASQTATTSTEAGGPDRVEEYHTRKIDQPGEPGPEIPDVCPINEAPGGVPDGEQAAQLQTIDEVSGETPDSRCRTTTSAVDGDQHDDGSDRSDVGEPAEDYSSDMTSEEDTLTSGDEDQAEGDAIPVNPFVRLERLNCGEDRVPRLIIDKKRLTERCDGRKRKAAKAESTLQKQRRLEATLDETAGDDWVLPLNSVQDVDETAEAANRFGPMVLRRNWLIAKKLDKMARVLIELLVTGEPTEEALASFSLQAMNMYGGALKTVQDQNEQIAALKEQLDKIEAIVTVQRERLFKVEGDTLDHKIKSSHLASTVIDTLLGNEVFIHEVNYEDAQFSRRPEVPLGAFFAGTTNGKRLVEFPLSKIEEAQKELSIVVRDAARALYSMTQSSRVELTPKLLLLTEGGKVPYPNVELLRKIENDPTTQPLAFHVHAVERKGTEAMEKVRSMEREYAQTAVTARSVEEGVKSLDNSCDYLRAAAEKSAREIHDLRELAINAEAANRLVKQDVTKVRQTVRTLKVQVDDLLDPSDYRRQRTRNTQYDETESEDEDNTSLRYELTWRCAYCQAHPGHEHDCPYILRVNRKSEIVGRGIEYPMLTREVCKTCSKPRTPYNKCYCLNAKQGLGIVAYCAYCCRPFNQCADWCVGTVSDRGGKITVEMLKRCFFPAAKYAVVGLTTMYDPEPDFGNCHFSTLSELRELKMKYPKGYYRLPITVLSDL